ncbi:MAG: hydantoinase B/oxoprolinase family protein, partial [Acidobacteria bacterium]|nr:hydantoinase B/oxoprolinase family protein [Acidobacteriota bacterium]
GTQARPELFALNIQKSSPLYAQVYEVDERLDNNGNPLSPLNLDSLKDTYQKLESPDSLAISLLHADKNPHHEQQLAAELTRHLTAPQSIGSELVHESHYLKRTQTTVVDAYLKPLITDYLQQIASKLAPNSLWVMTSGAGLHRADHFAPKDCLLSGPAGGISGAVAAAKASGLNQIISFDMGGTSTDVARYDGQFEYVFEHRVADAVLAAPALAIETVAAGGGSICDFQFDQLDVGTASAGALPGPACYGAGGPLTVTDVNLLLGRILTDHFEIPIYPERANEALLSLTQKIQQTGATCPEPIELLEGLRALANQHMANAIRRISLQKGYDPKSFTLVAFGGAGPQHAIAIAQELGMKKVLVPAFAGVLSTRGVAHANLEAMTTRQILKPLDSVVSNLKAALHALEDEAINDLLAQGWPTSGIQIQRRMATLRYQGQDHTLVIDIPAQLGELQDHFEKAYHQQFGYLPPGKRKLEVVTLRVIAAYSPTAPQNLAATPSSPLAAESAQAVFNGRQQAVPVFNRAGVANGQSLQGPCLIREPFCIINVEPGWEAQLDEQGNWLIRAMAEQENQSQNEWIRSELIGNRFESIAREMGVALQRSAISTNIKERLDFSCALLDPQGQLIVNAPHIPVHLGSLGMCVRSVIQHIPMQPGDSIITNHPGFGGSHLPDITLITRVDCNGQHLGYCASRAHHAELGGIRPGSMPPDAFQLLEEGVLIEPTILVRKGQANWPAITQILGSGPFPSRNIPDNLTDIQAALAANLRGAEALTQLVAEFSASEILETMNFLRQRAAQRIKKALLSQPHSQRTIQEVMDDGTPLNISLKLDQGHAHFHFSAPLHPGNLNATPAIVNSVVLYVLRLLIDEPLPLNEGLMEHVTIQIEPGLLNPDFSKPDAAPAIVGGNVETSQRLANALIRMLGLAADSQGSMNNFLFGNQSLAYYETIGGGSGAGPNFQGADAVHTHMTNTQITDPEILEQRFPVRLFEFAIRKGSGGAGQWRGGDGIRRVFQFLKPLTCSILSQNRNTQPQGLNGGCPGQSGHQTLIQRGTAQALEPIARFEVGPGDILEIETPGGGGYGKDPKQ